MASAPAVDEDDQVPASPVVVVGAGPTGVMAALTLALHGVEVVLLERHAEIWALPRAVHLDDEVARLLQGVGLGPAFAALSRPGRGLRLLDASHRVLAEFPRSPEPSRHGHPQANLFDQPDLERVMRARLRECPGVRLRTQVEVLGVSRGRSPAVDLRDRTTGRVERLPAAAVLGCDGADSLVRRAIGASWRDLRFTERWLVVDVRCALPVPAWEGVHQVCGPGRAATFLRVGPDRYRWEFALGEDEHAEDLTRPHVLSTLVAPWTGDVPFDRLEVLRSGEYVFRARLADRWQDERVFLLGDAAHLTPPFVGQGLGAGLRDAANLAWKLAAVLRGRAPEALLDTYSLERRPHARSAVRLAVTAGWAMTGGAGQAAAVRRATLGGICRVPAAARLLDRVSPRLVPGPLVPRARWRGERLAGSLAPQPRVRTWAGAAGPAHASTPLLDDVLGPGFAVLTRVAADPALRRLADDLGAPLLHLVGGRPDRGHPVDDTVDDGGALAGWLRTSGACAAVLRPDRVVLATTRSSSAPGADLRRRHRAVLRLVGA